MSKRYLDCILAEQEERCQSRTLKALLQQFKMVLIYHLPCSLRFINVVAILYVKANSKEICKDISFLFFRKMQMSEFLFRFNVSYLDKMRG